VQVLHQAKEDVLFDAAKVESFFGVPPQQVIDVLGQIAAAAPGGGESSVARNARKAMDAVLRGVVAYSSVG